MRVEKPIIGERTVVGQAFDEFLKDTKLVYNKIRKI